MAEEEKKERKNLETLGILSSYKCRRSNFHTKLDSQESSWLGSMYYSSTLLMIFLRTKRKQPNFANFKFI